jgi:hypothetical protein
MPFYSKIDAVLFSKKTVGTTPTQVNFFDSTTGTNLPTPNTLPANWKRFRIDAIKLFVNKFINLANIQTLMAGSYFELKVSNYVLLSNNLSKLVNYKFNLVLTPSASANIYEVSDNATFGDNGYFELKKPITLEPNMTFNFTIYIDASYTDINNADVYVLFRGILEKEIVG